MSKHTPEPWIFEGQAIYANRHPLSRHRNGRAAVANICTGDYDELDAEGMANGNLISAAPEMFDAALDVRGYVEAHAMALNDAGKTEASQQVLKSWDKLNSAIAKARGEAK